MDIYLYWPFARVEDIEFFEAIPSESDRLTLHTLDRPGAPASTSDLVTIRNDLPDVETGVRPPSPRWVYSRARTYQRRARIRRNTIAAGGFDVVHLAFLNQYTDIRSIRRLTQAVPLVVTVHDVVPHSIRLPKPAQYRLLNATYRSCRSIIVHHDEVRRELVDTFDVDPAAVTVVPHWVTNHRDSTSPRTRQTPPVALFLGTLRPNKGVEVLLDAIAKLGDAGIEFIIAGRGDPALEEAVRRASETLPHLQAEIGWVTPERKRELLLNANLCVLPYTSFSSQSGVLHDAYGAHLPVVVTDVGALGTSVRADRTGRVVPAHDTGALTTAISELLTDTQEWSTASAAAQSVSARQSARAVGRDLRAAYERTTSSEATGR